MWSEEKFKAQIEAIEVRIEWREKSRRQAMADLAHTMERAIADDDSRYIVEWLPGHIKDLETILKDIQELQEDKKMYQFILTDGDN